MGLIRPPYRGDLIALEWLCYFRIHRDNTAQRNGEIIAQCYCAAAAVFKFINEPVPFLSVFPLQGFRVLKAGGLQRIEAIGFKY